MPSLSSWHSALSLQSAGVSCSQARRQMLSEWTHLQLASAVHAPDELIVLHVRLQSWFAGHFRLVRSFPHYVDSKLYERIS